MLALKKCHVNFLKKQKMPSLAAIAWFITRASESAYGCSVFLLCLVIWLWSPGEWFGVKTTQFKVACWQILQCLTSSWEFILWLFPFKTKCFQVSLFPFLNMYLFLSFSYNGTQGCRLSESARLQSGPASTPYLGWVCYWFYLLHQKDYLCVLRFSTLLKSKHYQIPIRVA